ncbi:hypothetical protein HGM15179_008812 [Zosterops borbonicus]|uniref:Uncharacterized protein n=1 Tax=Zosterops borbonicus TaxID=364589 RepID=A0A8K1GG75_9PASS|nr:hypothetical protein HGM15179_008812 [Zosterops borbonicus]
MPLAKDLVHPSLEDEKRKHKKKRLVQSPNSYFMDVKCPAEKANLELLNFFADVIGKLGLVSQQGLLTFIWESDQFLLPNLLSYASTVTARVAKAK